MPRATAPGSGQPRTTILVVDDEPALVALVRTMLWRAGYNILEASSGEEALRIAAAEKGPIRMLVTDIVMPEMNGYDLAAKLSAERPEMKVLFMSGYRDGVIFDSTGVDAAERPLIRKPFTAYSLVTKITEMLQSDAGTRVSSA